MPWTAPRTWAQPEVVTDTMMNQHLRDNLLHLKTLDAYTAPTLLNSWVNYGSNTAPAGYFIDPQGRVSLRGTVNGGATGTVIFTLPTGYRPAYFLYFPIVVNGGLGYVQVEPDGDVVLISGTGWASLDPVTFRV